MTPGQPHSPSGRASLPRRGLLIAGLAALVVAGCLWLMQRTPDPSGADAAPASPAAATYVGSNRCARCHEAQTTGWLGSQHRLAMQHANSGSVLGRFDGAGYEYAGVTSSFLQRDGRYFVRTDGPEGALADFEVKYAFGVYPLQQYLVELPGGRIQALSLAWDSRAAGRGGQRWFHLYPGERIDHRDELHWTRRQQNWNFMCADCHSTGVRKGYDGADDRFATTFAEISVGCEACHGPGSAHLAWAETRRTDDRGKGLTVQLDERRGVAWRQDPATGMPRRSVARTSEREIDVCAQCHARRSQIAEGYRAGQPFLDHYLPSLVAPTLYHADGQQREEVFIWGSWLQSRMHAAGVTCSDCHDPHTQKLRAAGNAVCAQCHAPGRYDVEAHHRHPVGTAGAQCVACHMRQETYMVVDPRRDHGMRVPRPDQTVALRVPNACNDCHRETDAAWAARWVRTWLGRDARGGESFAGAFHGAERGEAAAIARLGEIARDAAQPPIVRASALERSALAGRYDAQAVLSGSQDASPLVRLGATRLAELADPGARRALAPLLTDATRAVRIEAARVMAPSVALLDEAARAVWQRAADEYVETLRYVADRPESHVALGSFHAALGRHAEALAEFETALRMDPDFEPAYVNGADASRASGEDAAAVAMLRRGLARRPQSAPLHHALGLALVRTGDSRAAVASLGRAAELAPDEPRYTYVHAVALDSTGEPEAAIATLERAARRWPENRDVLFALAAFEARAGRSEAARRTVTQLLKAFPEDQEARALAARL